MFSCIKGQQNDDNDEMQNDSTTTAVDSTMQVTGVAVDGAMNSISLVVDGDTVDFSYPDLDNDHRASWDIDDTVTVRYVVTQYGDTAGPNHRQRQQIITCCGSSSVGRASASQAEGRGSESRLPLKQSNTLTIKDLNP